MTSGPEADPDLLLITLDALRYDVAVDSILAGKTPFLQQLLPHGWQQRHTPGSFTYAAHAAIFAGFWPTPVSSGCEQRPFALRFQGSRTVGKETRILDGDNIVEGLRRSGYYTICVGGVGFFNRLNPLGSVFPRMFDESHWDPSFGVSAPRSTRSQVSQAISSLNEVSSDRPVFLFVNVSATHAPTYFYLRGAKVDSTATQAAALAYVDRQLPLLFEAFRLRRRSGRAFLMSDHGTLFGEDGMHGHRLAHPAVWNVPYAEASWESER